MKRSHQDNDSGMEYDVTKKLFLGNLSFDTKESTLMEYFSKFGSVKNAWTVKNKDGSSRGYGFVVFIDEDAVDKCQAARPHSIDDRRVNTKRSTLRESDARNTIESDQIYCGGIVDQLTEKDVKAYFEEYGKIKEFTMKRKPGSFGFAIIRFEDFDIVDKLCIIGKHNINQISRCKVRKFLSREEEALAERKNIKLGKGGMGTSPPDYDFNMGGPRRGYQGGPPMGYPDGPPRGPPRGMGGPPGGFPDRYGMRSPPDMDRDFGGFGGGFGEDPELMGEFMRYKQNFRLNIGGGAAPGGPKGGAAFEIQKNRELFLEMEKLEMIRAENERNPTDENKEKFRKQRNIISNLKRQSKRDCYRCGQTGHYARDCVLDKKEGDLRPGGPGRGGPGGPGFGGPGGPGFGGNQQWGQFSNNGPQNLNMDMDMNMDMGGINNPVMRPGGGPSAEVNALHAKKQKIAEEKAKLQAEILAQEAELEEMELLKLQQKKLEMLKRKKEAMSSGGTMSSNNGSGDEPMMFNFDEDLEISEMDPNSSGTHSQNTLDNNAEGNNNNDHEVHLARGVGAMLFGKSNKTEASENSHNAEDENDVEMVDQVEDGGNRGTHPARGVAAMLSSITAKPKQQKNESQDNNRKGTNPARGVAALLAAMSNEGDFEHEKVEDPGITAVNAAKTKKQKGKEQSKNRKQKQAHEMIPAFGVQEMVPAFGVGTKVYDYDEPIPSFGGGSSGRKSRFDTMGVKQKSPRKSRFDSIFEDSQYSAQTTGSVGLDPKWKIRQSLSQTSKEQSYGESYNQGYGYGNDSQNYGNYGNKRYQESFGNNNYEESYNSGNTGRYQSSGYESSYGYGNQGYGSEDRYGYGNQGYGSEAGYGYGTKGYGHEYESYGNLNIDYDNSFNANPRDQDAAEIYQKQLQAQEVYVREVTSDVFQKQVPVSSYSHSEASKGQTYEESYKSGNQGYGYSDSQEVVNRERNSHSYEAQEQDQEMEDYEQYQQHQQRPRRTGVADMLRIAEDQSAFETEPISKPSKRDIQWEERFIPCPPKKKEKSPEREGPKVYGSALGAFLSSLRDDPPDVPEPNPPLPSEPSPTPPPPPNSTKQKSRWGPELTAQRTAKKINEALKKKQEKQKGKQKEVVTKDNAIQGYSKFKASGVLGKVGELPSYTDPAQGPYSVKPDPAGVKSALKPVFQPPKNMAKSSEKIHIIPPPTLPDALKPKKYVPPPKNSPVYAQTPVSYSGGVQTGTYFAQAANSAQPVHSYTPEDYTMAVGYYQQFNAANIPGWGQYGTGNSQY